MEIPKVNNYYFGQSGVPQANAIAITIKDITLYFSYKTLVALKDDNGLIISENLWGNTTSRHLNAIEPSEKPRMKRNDFIIEVKKRLAKV